MASFKSSICLLCMAIMLSLVDVEGLVVSNELRGLKSTARSFSPRHNTDSMYMPVPEPTQSRKMAMSPSVLASCDTLPSFHTAHGLLSPETVLRLEKMTSQPPALRKFLTTYRRDGPMSCLCMLSDPDILPHLTSAMRDLL